MGLFTRGLCMNIAGFIRNSKYPQDYVGTFLRADGTPMSPDGALAYLATEKARGRTVLPCSHECGNPCKHSDRGCTGFDYNGSGCPGREAD
ncbi:MAG TPA: hypothetical protein VHQ92_13440 [Pseudolabrys sp.]|jgi:hypothetical protein|nr:hypothetical protein [Pseudolabrys sp.]